MTSEICANCGWSRYDHTAHDHIEGSKAVCKKFKPQKQEICANCGNLKNCKLVNSITCNNWKPQVVSSSGSDDICEKCGAIKHYAGVLLKGKQFKPKK